MKEHLECLRALQALQALSSSDMRDEAISTTMSSAADVMENASLLEQARFLHQALGAAPRIMRADAYVKWILRPRMLRYLLGIAEDPETLAWVKGNSNS